MPRAALAVALCSALLMGCSPGDDNSKKKNPDGLGSGVTHFIEAGPQATADMVAAMVSVVPGDTIEFDCGFFDLTTTLQLANTEAIIIKGCGKDQTVLSFRNSTQQVGILGINSRGLVIQDLTVADTDGNGFELRAVDHGTLSRVRAFWSSGGGRESADPIAADNYGDGRMNVACTQPATLDPRAPENEGRPETQSPDYTVSDKAGRYGIYPVSSDNILIEGSESIGASDAGIYVGQTNNTIIRTSRAAFNVFGFEIENVQGGEYYDNVAECNTGGFLVYDLDGNLRQYGDRTRMYRNVSRDNNTYNFTEGGFVANVPPGSGMITLSYDRIDVFENTFENNNTGGIIHASYELFPEGAGRPTEKRIDFYTEGMHIWNNTFVNNGNRLPVATTNDLQNQDIARLLPALVGLKNQAACALPTNAATCAAAVNEDAPQSATGYRGAHIVWDGLLDELDADCPYPMQADGVTPVPEDERGKPQHTNQEDPACHYNAYKFEADGERARIVPDWWASCIDANNSFSGDSLTFANFHGTRGLEAVIAAATASQDEAGLVKVLDGLQATDYANFASSFDLAPHDCPTAYGRNLPPLPAVVIPPFVPSGDVDPTPSEQEIKKLCRKKVAAGAANFDAARVNCPLLSHYNLFSDAEDPTSTPNGAGLPFALNTKLFSDYSVKYRVLFMPAGAKAIYKDASTDGPNATLIFPAGTIIAKTFAFADEPSGTESAVETRLLIKRVNSKTNDARWDGLVYIWKTGTDGKRYAELTPTGGTASVSWDLHDVDSGAHLAGSAPAYQIPNHNQCLSCHSREDSEPGAAPIGLKVRNLNRPYQSESPIGTQQGEMEIKGRNQVAWLCERGLMLGCPDLGVNAATQVAENVERLPIFNKPGDAGFAAGSGEDIESRARAYLEVNCQHCHNVRGFAASTGLYLNASGPVGLAHGICKKPTATGSEGSGGRPVDIWPADPSRSILEYRIGPEATSPAARMPSLARSVVHDEGHALIEQWIRDVIVVDEEQYPNSSGCE
ncbi:MAG: parallel beta-helix domain-containing protein [Nevskiaceae bacterium]